MDLPEFHIKHLLQEEIEVILKKNFPLSLTAVFVVIIFLNRSEKLPLVQS